MASNNTPDFSYLAPAELKEQTPIQGLADTIKQKVEFQSLGNSDLSNLYSFSNVNNLNQDNRIQTVDYTTPFTDLYAPLNSGEYIARYENFLPNTNNEERLAQGQTSGEKWTNGFTKFLGKTGTAVLGGTVGVVDSLISGVTQGSLSAAYNSDLNTWLDDLNTKMDYKLPNYYSEQEKNAGFLDSTTSANFWANDVLSGLSFTTGAIISEGLWAAATGGTSLLAKGALGSAARWGTEALGEVKTLSSLSKMKSWAKQPIRAAAEATEAAVEGGIPKTGFGIVEDATKNAAISGYRATKALEQGRFLLTSAGYESGMEARFYTKQAEEAWKQQNPNATPEEIADFRNTNANAANAVFALNLAVVGSSNLAAFGNLALGKTITPQVSNNVLQRTLFGVGFDKTAAGTFKAVQATRAQKIAGKVWGVAKYGVLEGAYEEGGQSVISSTAENYVLNGYSKDKTKNSLGITDAFYDALSHTFGTKEGFKEVGIGMIIGILGGAVSTRGRFNELSSERQAIDDALTYQNGLTKPMIVQKLISGNKIQNAQENAEVAQQQNDLPGEVLANRSAIVAAVERDYVFQGVEEGIKDFTTAIKSYPTEQLQEDLGISVEEVEDWKAEKINEYTTVAKEHSKNLQFAQALLGTSDIAGLNKDQLTKSQIEQGIAFNITMGKQALEINQNLLANIKSLVAQGLTTTESTYALDTEDALEQIDQTKRREYELKQKQVGSAQRRLTSLERRVLAAQSDTSEQRVQKLTAINQELLDATNELQTLEAQKNLAFAALGIETVSNGTFISQEMVDNQQQNLEKFQAALQNIKSIDPQRHSTITELLKQQSKAVSHVKEYDNVSRQIFDPKLRVKLLNGWVTSLLNRNTELEAGTAEFFRRVAQNYKQNTTETFQEITEVTERNNFRQGKEVTPEYLQSLKDQLEKGFTLNQIDQEILDSLKERVEEETLSAITTPENSIQEKRKQIEALKQLKNKVYPLLKNTNLEKIEKTLESYNLQEDFEFIKQYLIDSEIGVSFDGAHIGGLPTIASMDTAVLDGKLSNILTINKAAFDKMSKSEKIEVLSHEFVHGLINLKLNEQGKTGDKSFHNGLSKIFKKVTDFTKTEQGKAYIKNNFSGTDDIQGKIRYIESDIEEFATLGLTDPAFIKLLKNIEAEDVQVTKETLWSKLTQIVSKLIGLDNSVFNNLLNYISTNLDTNINYSDKEQINLKIQNLNKEIETLSRGETSDPITALQDKVKAIIAGNEYLTSYFGEDVEELSKRNPSAQEIEKYQELLSKVNSTNIPVLQNLINRPSDYFQKRKVDTGLTIEEINEFKQLNQVLNDWKTLNGSVDGDNSVASLLEMIEKLKTQAAKSETKLTLEDKDLKTVLETNDILAKQEESTNRGVQTQSNGLATFGKDVVTFNHISINTLAQFFPGAVLSIANQNNVLTDADLAKLSKKEGTEFSLQVGEETLSVRVNNRAGLEVNRKKFEELQSQSNVIIKQWGSKSVSTAIHQLVGDTYVPVKSDFDYQSINPADNWTINETAVNEVKAGDTLDLLISLDDVYNAELLKNTENLSKEEKQRQINSLHIYTLKGGTRELLGSLPATQQKEIEAEVGKELQQLRKNAYKQALAAKKKGQKEIKLNEKVEATIAFLGSPNLEMELIGSTVQVKNLPFTDEALTTVRGTGFIQGTEITTNTQIDDKQFVDRLGKLNPNSKVPFVVFENNGRTIAFPVTLTQTTIDKSVDVSNILNSQIPSNDKANTLIDTLIDSGLTPSNYKIDYSNEDWIYSPEVERALTDLSQVVSFVDVEEFAQKGYNKQNLKLDAQIPIQLDNKPFQTNKILFKVSDKLSNDPISFGEQAESLEEQKLKMVDELNTEAENLYADYLRNPAYQNILTGNFIETLDDTPIEIAESYVEKIRNINTLRKALSGTISGKTKTAIGEQNIKELRQMLKVYDDLNKKEQLVKVEIKKPNLTTPIYGNFRLIESIPYDNVDKNKYKPNQQLKFNQGNNFEPVRIVASEKLISLITLGSKVNKQYGGKPQNINYELRIQLEKELGMGALEAYNKARDIAKQGRSSAMENILVLGEVIDLQKEINELNKPC